MRKPSLATALKHEVRRHSLREIGKTRLRLRKLQTELTALRREARKDRQALVKLKARVGRLGTRAAATTLRRRGDGPGRRTSPQTIRTLRERMGLSRKKFAKLLSVSPGSIFGWETGRTTPRRESLARFRALKKAGLRAARAEAGTAAKRRPGRRAAVRG